MCCGTCSKWQHISCHDQADFQDGRPKRNWEHEDFTCRQCRLRKAVSGGHHQHQSSASQNPYISLHIPPTANAAASNGSYNPYLYTDFSRSNQQPSDGYASESQNYPHPPTKSYSQSSQMSDTRVAPAPSQGPSYPSAKPAAFSHYDPQNIPFSAAAPQAQPRHQAYNTASAPTQSYGQLAASSQPQYPQQYHQDAATNGNGQVLHPYAGVRGMFPSL